MRVPRLLPLVLLCALPLTLVACSGRGTSNGTPTAPSTTTVATSTPSDPPSVPTATGSSAAGPGAQPRPVSLVPTSSRNWARPTEMGVYPSPTGAAPGIFVAEQDGTVYHVSGDQVTPILDLTDRVLRSGNEEGLLSVALDPGFATNRYVWVYYSAGNPRRSVLARFTRNAAGGAIDKASQLIVLEFAQPFANHNGGAIRFGPDGMLYLGLGDGGSAGDPQGNGQNLRVLLGKIIRIDVRNASKEQPYSVPSDNPFVSRQGARPEIWAYGMRNPWRMAFDAATGALWVGDVGQGAVEEIDIATRGGNFGWSITEGDRCYKPSSNCDRTGLVAPVTAYGHDGGRCSVVGGMVYRGSKVPEIAGSYVYGDTCSGELWAINAASPQTPVLIASGVKNMTSFGLDAEGEITVLSFGQPIRRLASK